MVGAFEWRGQLVGTVRAVPLGLGLTACDAVLAASSEDSITPQMRLSAWEMGRLVLAPEHRIGADAIVTCVRLALLYLLGHAEFANGFALCRSPLARLYRRVGFRSLDAGAVPPGGERFSLIHTSAPALLNALVAGDLQRRSGQFQKRALQWGCAALQPRRVTVPGAAGMLQ